MAQINWRQYVRSHLPQLAVSPSRENDIVEELAAQLESIYERAKSAGASEAEAVDAVRREVPDWQALAESFVRIEGTTRPVDRAADASSFGAASIATDCRDAVRSLAGWRAFPASAIMLGCSIAALLAVIAATRSWTPPDFPQHERLALVWGTNHAIGQARDVVSGPTFLDWQAQNTTFEYMAAFAQGDLTIRRDGQADVLGSLIVTPEFFNVTGTRAAVGRVLGSGDIGVPRIMISHGFWQSQFAGDPGVIGRTMTSLGQPHEIVGILPEQFRLFAAPDVVTLIDPRQLEKEARTFYYYWVVARLRESSTLDVAQRDLDGVMARLSAAHPSMKGWTATVESMDETLGEPVRASLTVLVSIALLVLVVGIGNTTNLVVSRLLSRRREFAIRAALGASPSRIRRQWLIEGMLLSGVAATLGIMLAYVAIVAIAGAAPASAVIAGSAATVELEPLSFDGASVAWAAALAVIIGLFLGVLPLGSASENIRDAAARSPMLLTTGRQWLLAGQTAIATLLTAIAGVLLLVVVKLMATSPGFDPTHVTALLVGQVHELGPRARTDYYARLLDRVGTEPGVTSVALNDYVPLTNEDDYEGFEIPGRARDGAGLPREEWRRISHTYFDTLGIPILHGRAFSAADDERGPSVVIVNSAMAKKYWPDANPVGSRIRITNKSYGWSEIVGVAADVLEVGLDRPAKPMMFVPYQREPRPVMGLFVRGHADVATIRRAVLDVDAGRPILDARGMIRIVEDSYAVQRSLLWMATALALLALALIAGGTYAVVALVSAARSREMGVRIALGAQRRDVAAAVLARPSAGIGIGAALGLVAAWPATRAIADRAGMAMSLDPATGAIAVGVVLAIVAVASASPVARACRTDPTITLRSES